MGLRETKSLTTEDAEKRASIVTAIVLDSWWVPRSLHSEPQKSWLYGRDDRKVGENLAYRKER